MIQGGYYGLRDWLKLDEDYLSRITGTHDDYPYETRLKDYCQWHGFDYEDPYDLLKALHLYRDANVKPWQHVIIDPKAMNDLALDAQMGNEDGRELLVLYMYRAVARISNRFKWAQERFLLENTDLIHQGILGIYKALEKWSADEKIDFPRWSDSWIHRSIQDIVSGSIELPYHIRMLQGRLPKIRKELEEEILERPASYEELAFYIRAEGYDSGIRSNTSKHSKMVTGPEIAMLETYNLYSLNQVVNNDEIDYTEVMDIIPDDGSNLLQGSSNLIREVEYRDLLETLMDRLDDIERFVLMNYNKGIMGKLKAREVAEELVDKSMTDSIYSPSRITQTFERACIKIRDAAEDLDLDKDMIFE